MNILIVDDEISSVNAVIKGIHWDELPIISVYTANSMQEAIEQINGNDIDIMLSDIEMPMGTGLELLRWVKDKKVEVECIFMTCHADFSFAQNAIQLGCIDYLLKPLDYSKVENSIKKAIVKITNERILQINSSAWLKNKSIVYRQFWKDFFTGDILPNRNSLIQYIRSKNIEIDVDKNYIPLLISIKNNQDDFSEEEHRLMEFAIRNISNEIFVSENISKEIISFNENSILIMFELDNEIARKENIIWISDSCERLIDVVKQFFKLLICCYVGRHGSIYSIPNQIENLQVVDFQNVAYQQKLFVLESLKHYRLEYNNSVFKTWNELIKENKFGQLLLEIKQMLTAEENLKKVDRVFLQNFYQDYYYILIAFSSKHNLFLSELFGDVKSQRVFHNALISLDYLLLWIEYTISMMKNYIAKNVEDLNPVEKTKRYINNHIAEEISMSDISQNVHLNADYLTRVFKKECGVSINKYIINLKMDIAKKLLIETEKSIGEIAMGVGYFNYSSFNKIFTKNEMISPQEYKKLYKNK